LTSQTYQGDTRFTPPTTGTFSYGESGYGPHVLTGLASAEGNETYTYDSNGNMIGNGAGATQHWDPKDRLIAASEDGVEHTHFYDYASKRSIHQVTKNGRTSRTYYVDDVSEFRDGRLVKYLYVGSEKVARADFSGNFGQAIAPDLFYLHDHLGSTIFALDGAGRVRQISSYSPYGYNRFKSIEGTQPIDYGFSGKELHGMPDLSYFETRFLSSGLARFTQTDTLTLNPPDDWRMSPQKWHPYSYCWGNPVTMVDKDGRNAEKQAHMAALEKQYLAAKVRHEFSSSVARDFFESGGRRLIESASGALVGKYGTDSLKTGYLGFQAEDVSRKSNSEVLNFALTEALNTHTPLLGDAVNAFGAILEISASAVFAIDSEIERIGMGDYEIEIMRVQKEIDFDKTLSDIARDLSVHNPGPISGQPIGSQSFLPVMP
jgi:RHS repeat-associated protein